MNRPKPPAPLPDRRSVLGVAGGVLAAAVLRVLPAAGTVLASGAAGAASEPRLSVFDLQRDEDGLHLSYAVDLDLGKPVDDALAKSVPLFFVADVEVFQDRWWWRDRRVAHAIRTYRIVYQPLTANYRVTSVGGLSQNYASRGDALASLSRASRWKIAEPAQIDDGRHYVEFQYRLDTSQLPRPMQIGIGGDSDWQIVVRRTQRLG